MRIRIILLMVLVPLLQACSGDSGIDKDISHAEAAAAADILSFTHYKSSGPVFLLYRILATNELAAPARYHSPSPMKKLLLRAKQYSQSQQQAPVIIDEGEIPCNQGSYMLLYTVDDETNEEQISLTYNDCRNNSADGSYVVETGTETYGFSTTSNNDLQLTLESDKYQWMEYDADGVLLWKSVQNLSLQTIVDPEVTRFDMSISGTDKYNASADGYVYKTGYTKFSIQGTISDISQFLLSATLNGKDTTDITYEGNDWQIATRYKDFSVTLAEDGVYLEGKLNEQSDPEYCSDGSYTYNTLSPLYTDYYGYLIGGSVEINGRMQADYNSDGSVRITDNKGVSDQFSETELYNICTIIANELP